MPALVIAPTAQWTSPVKTATLTDSSSDFMTAQEESTKSAAALKGDEREKLEESGIIGPPEETADEAKEEESKHDARVKQQRQEDEALASEAAAADEAAVHDSDAADEAAEVAETDRIEGEQGERQTDHDEAATTAVEAKQNDDEDKIKMQAKAADAAAILSSAQFSVTSSPSLKKNPAKTNKKERLVMSEGDTSSVPDSKFAEPPPLSVKERAAQMSAKDGGQRSVSPPAYTKLSGDRLCKQRTLPSVSTCKSTD